MSKTTVPIKYSENGLILCSACIKAKNRSRRFPSLHALKWHITREHRGEALQE